MRIQETDNEDSGIMTKNKAMMVKANIEKILKRHKIWYDVEYVFKSDGLDCIRFKEVSIKITGKDESKKNPA